MGNSPPKSFNFLRRTKFLFSFNRRVPPCATIDRDRTRPTRMPENRSSIWKTRGEKFHATANLGLNWISQPDSSRVELLNTYGISLGEASNLAAKGARNGEIERNRTKKKKKKKENEKSGGRRDFDSRENIIGPRALTSSCSSFGDNFLFTRQRFRPA